ncbi:MAG: helix-turn-helix transcriptional regulator [Lachnospirales bacterium]
MEKNYSTIVTVEEVSSYCNLSRNYLNKLFREELNETLQERLTNVRLGKAVYYSQNTNVTIEEISYLVGFGSSLNFYRNFKKNYSIPPKVWRDKNISISNPR